MSERVLFVPSIFVSPRSWQALPAYRQALGDLQRSCTVEVFEWPWVLGAEKVEPRPPEVALALKRRISPGDHVISSGSGSPATLLALNGAGEVSSFVCQDLGLSPAALTGVGEQDIASAMHATLLLLTTGSYAYLRATMVGASDADIKEAARALDAELDLELLASVIRAYGEFNLLDQTLSLPMPTLYLASADSVRPTVTAKLFQKLVPQAEVKTTQSWITQYHRLEAGAEFSSLVLPFIKKHRRPAD